MKKLFTTLLLLCSAMFAQDNGQSYLRNLMTTKGDMLTSDGHNPLRLPACPNGQFRTSDSTQPSGWSTCTTVSTTSGPGAGFTYRGAWAASTAYSVNDVVSNAGSTYVVTTAFTSGSSFSASNMSVWAAAGTNGTNGTNGVSTAAGVVALFSGCTVGTQYLGVDGTCHTVSTTGGASSFSQLGLLEATRVDSTHLTIGASCSASTPCNVQYNNAVWRILAPGNISITAGSSSDTILVWVDAAGVLQVGVNSANTTVCTSGCTVNTSQAAFPNNVPIAPIYIWPVVTGGTLATTGATDLRSALKINQTVYGTGLSVTSDTNGTQTVSASGGATSVVSVPKEEWHNISVDKGNGTVSIDGCDLRGQAATNNVFGAYFIQQTYPGYSMYMSQVYTGTGGPTYYGVVCHFDAPTYYVNGVATSHTWTMDAGVTWSQDQGGSGNIGFSFKACAEIPGTGTSPCTLGALNTPTPVALPASNVPQATFQTGLLSITTPATPGGTRVYVEISRNSSDTYANPVAIHSFGAIFRP